MAMLPPAHRRILAVAGLMGFMLVLPSPGPGGAYSPAENVRYFALYFGCGAVAAALKQHIVVSAPITAFLALLYCVTIRTPWVELTCALFLTSAMLLVATQPFGRLREWTSRHDLSFGIYIFAAPLQQAMLTLVPGLGPTALSLAVLPAVLALAYLSWSCVEKPAMAQRVPLLQALGFGATALASARRSV